MTVETMMFLFVLIGASLLRCDSRLLVDHEGGSSSSVVLSLSSPAPAPALAPAPAPTPKSQDAVKHGPKFLAYPHLPHPTSFTLGIVFFCVVFIVVPLAPLLWSCLAQLAVHPTPDTGPTEAEMTPMGSPLAHLRSSLPLVSVEDIPGIIHTSSSDGSQLPFSIIECVICMDDLQSQPSVVLPKCKHAMHSSCLTRWMLVQTRANVKTFCPVCKDELRVGV